MAGALRVCAADEAGGRRGRPPRLEAARRSGEMLLSIGEAAIRAGAAGEAASLGRRGRGERGRGGG
jgi:hypothetical protein